MSADACAPERRAGFRGAADAGGAWQGVLIFGSTGTSPMGARTFAQYPVSRTAEITAGRSPRRYNPASCIEVAA